MNKTFIEHIKTKQSDNVGIYEKEIKTSVPKYLEEFQELSVFGPAWNFPKPEECPGPFIGSKDIELTDGERQILRKDPKFSLRQEVTEMEFLLETEKMLSKRKFTEQCTQKERTSSCF